MDSVMIDSPSEISKIYGYEEEDLRELVRTVIKESMQALVEDLFTNNQNDVSKLVDLMIEQESDLEE